MQKLVKISAAVVALLPTLTLAQTVQTGYIESIIKAASRILDQLVVVLIALAVVWFIWNVVKYTMSSDDDEKTKAKGQMIWGIIAIAVIVSVWGLVALLQTVSGVEKNTGANSFNIKGLAPKL